MTIEVTISEESCGHRRIDTVTGEDDDFKVDVAFRCLVASKDDSEHRRTVREIK